MQKKNIIPILQVAPLTVLLIVFVLIPLALIVAVSFFRYSLFTGTAPDFIFKNYIVIFSNPVNYKLFLSVLKFTVIVWALTFVLGFTLAHFLVFHVRSLLIAIGLFLVCTVPFWTSNIIRMISWKPLLGKFGLINSTLMDIGLIEEPIMWLLFSDFSVIVAYTHLFTLFMIVPIFNSMARIDKALIEAAVDAGASRWSVIWNIILPLSKTGIALGSVFVVTMVMGDFFIVKVMSGGLSGSVTMSIYNDISILNYPRGAANSVILLAFVMLIGGAILRAVDVRKELTG